MPILFYEKLLFCCEIILLVLSVIVLVISLFKDSSAREALASISGGSQELFLNKKAKLSSSLVTILLLIMTGLIFALIITVRIILNTS